MTLGITKAIQDLTAAERAEICDFAHRHGRNWRAHLYREWQANRANQPLAWARTRLGRIGMNTLTRADYEPKEGLGL
jgi:hypothetical protein